MQVNAIACHIGGPPDLHLALFEVADDKSVQKCLQINDLRMTALLVAALNICLGGEC